MRQYGTMRADDFWPVFFDRNVNIGVICRSEDEFCAICIAARENAPRFGVNFHSHFSIDEHIMRNLYKDGNDGAYGVDYYKGEQLLSTGSRFYIEDTDDEGFGFIEFSDIVWEETSPASLDGLF